MITLTNKTSIALLLVLMKSHYGKSWYTKDGDSIIAGIHAPTGEIAYKIPSEYAEQLKGMIELDVADDLSTTFEGDTSERLLQWISQL